jgi:protein-arginine kinase activator protein McsA
MITEITVNNTEEFQLLVENRDFRISKAIVEGILNNLSSRKKHIHVLTVTCLEEDDVFDITVERKYFIETLEENLPHFIREEEYEYCTKIVNAVNTLKTLPTPKQRKSKKDLAS